MYNSMSFEKHTQVCNPHYNQNTEQLHPLPNLHAPCSIPPLNPVPGNHWSILYPYSFASSSGSHKLNHIINHLLSEASFP